MDPMAEGGAGGGPADARGVSGWPLWRAVLAIAACLFLEWISFVQGRRVPLLGLVDLGFHELGHLVTMWLPSLVTAMSGSGAQVLVPIGLAAYFALKRRELASAGLCLAWAGTAARDASVYVADAPYQQLELIGGEHDWAYILGPEQLDILHLAGPIASGVKVTGLALLLAGMVACAVSAFAGASRTADPVPVTWSSGSP